MSVLTLTICPWAQSHLIFENGSIYNEGTRTLFDRPSQKRIHLTLTEFIEYCGKGSLPSPLVNQELAIFHWPVDLIPVPYYWGETFATELRTEKWFAQECQKGHLQQSAAIHRVQRAFVAMFLDSPKGFDTIWRIGFDNKFPGLTLSDEALTTLWKTEKDKLSSWRRRNSTASQVASVHDSMT